MTTNTGGPAFPLNYFDKQLNESRSMSGMTLRDFFAAKVMPLAANLDVEYRGDKKTMDVEYVAILAYEIADAMLKARG